MVQGIVSPAFIEAPPITARPGELLDAATVHEGLGWLEPSGIFESYNCLTTDSVPLWPCPAVTLTAPAASAPATATTGGTVPAGTYRAVITAYNSRGETLKSSEVSQVTTGATSTVTWSWLAVAGASGYKVYVTNGAPGTENSYVTIVGQPNTFTVMTSYPWVGAQPGTPPTANGAIVPQTKNFGAPGWIDGIRFAVYAGSKCKMTDAAHSKSEVEAAFLAAESVGVARALMTNRLVGGSGFPATLDLSGAGNVNPAEGLALLENWAADNYAGVPTIHVGRGIGTLLFAQRSLVRDGNVFMSQQGSKVASDGGYGNPNLAPGGANAAAGFSWMYATGEVVVARGDMISQVTIDQVTNDVVVLVERPYVAAVDCFSVAVKVTTDLS
jgi:hypothetical protein